MLAALLPVFRSSRDALSPLVQDAALMLSLAELLIPGFAALAVALQLPAERRPEGYSWRRAARTAKPLAVLCMSAPDGALAARVASGSGPVPKLLPAAVQLLLHAPLPTPAPAVEPSEEATDWDDLAGLMGALSVAVAAQVDALTLRPSQPRLGSGEDPAERTASLLLPLLPRLVRIFKALMAETQVGAPAKTAPAD